jgi:hypothetical protein
MNNRSLFLLGALVGGTIGSFVPELWGGSLLGGWSILFSTIGGLLGIWGAYKIAHV